MKKNLFRSLCAAAMLMLGLCSAQAEDIDLFVGYNQTVTEAPNVLFVVDNTANWTPLFTAEMNALASAFESLPTGKFKVGVMMFTETGGGNSNVDGAYLRAGVRLLDDANKLNYGTLIRSLDVRDDKSNGGKAGKMMAEVYRYLASGAPMAGNNKAKADYAGNVFGTAASKAIYALPGNPLAAVNSNTYIGPNTTNCIGTYVIYISNGAAQDNNSDTTISANALRAAGGDATTIPLGVSGSQDNVADEWARFLQSSMGVKVYTVEAATADGGQGPGWTALLNSMSTQSKGGYYDISTEPDLGAALSGALDDIFSKIQSVNSVFSSVSLPVSVNTQGTYLNQVFVGMFRPDDSAYPRWNGNLKQYKLGVDGSNQLILQDAAGANAINNQTGFIAPCARSFWTPANRNTYWSFNPSGDCISSDTTIDLRASDSPDGNVVEKGAQAYMLRQMATADRNVMTCAPGTCSALTSFADGNASITSTDLGAQTTTERTALINWLRGLDNKGDERRDTTGNPLTSTTAMRPSVHGDVVHSRPVAINYGSDDLANAQVVVFYGANDGVLRAVNGNQATAIGSAAPGSELWSFVPPEFYGSIKRLYDNTTRINFPGIPVSVGATAPKPYGMDGPMAAYRQGTSAWLYASMRRGGRLIYAFDVSNAAAPILKWRRGCPNQDNDVGCGTGANDMSGIGQTWSAPKIVKASGYGAGTTPMVMFGGGYDRCEDVDTTEGASACGAATKGNKIYVLDASTGDVLTKFDTVRAVSGEVTIVNDSTGLAKFAYAADLGGNVYRITMGTGAPASWEMAKIASLGCDDAAATCTPNRKFMFGPDVVEDNGMYVLLLGSGDREKPLRSYTAALSVSNRFYMLVDKPSDTTWLSAEASRCNGSSLLCHGSLFAITGTTAPSATELSAKKGWYLALAAGEQVVTSSVTAYGNTTFNTHTPTDPTVSQSCRSNLGTANVYNLSYLDAAGQNGARFQNVVGGGLAPSPVVGRVMVDGTLRDVVIGANPDSFLSPKGATVKAAFKQPKGRVYWFIQK
ncbi:putative type 4 pilus assembly protein, tip-associated adhesin PilY1 [Variovorax paradoxus B4]|uniref:Putative type 4 pilus assembly protein, tip-associated adhesin PilY1 n=1 Tax=Variovorax paradoxus B4 TaxID=1246301 RepID=T1XBX0_VARPD|nr:PilC/PilY family type IV pilus protein [Variovorax paradoxus]AGU49814.1 putative type 4 pilus assembly protein, tip-associated adhesin PilY1 [Variovorax paradoxus B4]